MKVTTLVLNPAGDPHFRSEEHFDTANLLKIAEDRVQNCRDKGADWTAGAIPFWAGEVLKAVEEGTDDDLSRATISMVMAAWLFDSIYCGVTAAQYHASDFEFTIAADGVVQHTRVPAAANESHA